MFLLPPNVTGRRSRGQGEGPHLDPNQAEMDHLVFRQIVTHRQSCLQLSVYWCVSDMSSGSGPLDLFGPRLHGYVWLEPSGIVEPDRVYPFPRRPLGDPVGEGEATGHHHGTAGELAGQFLLQLLHLKTQLPSVSNHTHTHAPYAYTHIHTHECMHTHTHVCVCVYAHTPGGCFIHSPSEGLQKQPRWSTGTSSPEDRKYTFRVLSRILSDHLQISEFIHEPPSTSHRCRSGPSAVALLSRPGSGNTRPARG